MELTDKEKSDFRNMIVACGRNPHDFSVTIDNGKEKITVANSRLGHVKSYQRDTQGSWVIAFATDMKLGRI